MTRRAVLAAFIILQGYLVQSIAAPQATTVFAGMPQIKISEGGVERLPENLTREKAANLVCVISRIGDKYYWASRENKEMVRFVSGAFITFVAVDGVGYVRTVAPGMKETVSLMGPTEMKFDYVEHALIGLKSITYYGVAR